MVNVLAPVPALIGVTGQLVVLGVGIGILNEIQKTPKRIKKQRNNFPRLTDL